MSTCVLQVAEYSKKRVQDALQRVEAELGKHAYIAGAEFSGADIMLAGSLNGIMVRTCLPVRVRWSHQLEPLTDINELGSYLSPHV